MTRLALAIAAWAVLTEGTSVAQSAHRESDVKAAYLLNFGRFTSWPPGAADAGGFVICVLGRDEVGRALDTAVAGETIAGKPVVFRAIDKSEDAAACRVLFISGKDNRRLKQILGDIDGVPTLTVSDMAGFVDQGGMIQFVPESNRVRFSVNVAAAERVGLAFSSELLRVAVGLVTRRNP